MSIVGGGGLRRQSMVKESFLPQQASVLENIDCSVEIYGTWAWAQDPHAILFQALLRRLVATRQQTHGSGNGT